MGKITGFLEFERAHESYQAVHERLAHHAEFVGRLSNKEVSIQGARCMDCGIPFCHNGCPVNNLIPDWNDWTYQDRWRVAIDTLHRTNNFPEFTGRICPAPCESACTLNIQNTPVAIKAIERAIVDYAWQQNWIQPYPPSQKSGKAVAVIGSGPSGLACAQQLARCGHDVTVFEKNDRIGGLLRYGIPDFKLDKSLIDRRVDQMKAEGVTFETCTLVGAKDVPAFTTSLATKHLKASWMLDSFDALILAGGSEIPRDLPIPGRGLPGVHFAMEFLVQQNRINANEIVAGAICAKDKHVVVIGGGDTGADCVGTANRQGAASVTQLEVMSQPPEMENKALTWPYWPLKLRTSSSHEEGCQREFSVSSQAFVGKDRVASLKLIRVEWKNGKIVEILGSETEIKAELVLLAMGFIHPLEALLDAFGVEKDARGNAHTNAENSERPYATSVSKVFAAGDMRRGQSLVVWAIREGRQCAEAVDGFLKMHHE